MVSSSFNRKKAMHMWKNKGNKILIAGICIIVGVNGGKAASQLVRESTKLGITTKTYILTKSEVNPGIYRFKTKTIIAGCYKTIDSQRCRLLLNGQRIGEAYVSNWRIANCLESTIDGNIVTVIPRWGFEEGQPELLRAICL